MKKSYILFFFIFFLPCFFSSPKFAKKIVMFSRIKNKNQNNKTRIIEKKNSSSLSGVTYDFSGGRFGDNLLAYMHAKWFAYRNRLQLLYKPFPYSEKLMMHYKETHFSQNLQCKKITIFSGKQTEIERYNTLYIIPYFPERVIIGAENVSRKFDVQWNDRQFKNDLQKMIAPMEPLALVKIPEGKISIAIHLRRFDNGFDAPAVADENCLTPIDAIPAFGHNYKFLNDSFYIEKIKEINKSLGHQPLFVFIFTDSINPPAIIEKYRAAIDEKNIEFACRPASHHTQNVLEDFFSMIQFDYLIRSVSNFSIAAEKLGNFMAVFSPD